jgi:hypothetical protein
LPSDLETTLENRLSGIYVQWHVPNPSAILVVSPASLDLSGLTYLHTSGIQDWRFETGSSPYPEVL